MKSEIDLDIGIGAIFQSLIAEVHTNLIAQVISFDKAKQTVSVQPVLQRKYKGQDPSNLSVGEDIPVLFFGSGDFVITVDVKKDSYVVLLVSERSLDKWFLQGGIVDPDDTRKFNLSDAIAIPGINPLPDTIVPPVEANCISIRNRLNTMFIKLDSTGISMKNKLTVDGVTRSNGVIDDTLKPATMVTLGAHTHNDSLGAPTTPPLPEPYIP